MLGRLVLVGAVASGLVGCTESNPLVEVQVVDSGTVENRPDAEAFSCEPCSRDNLLCDEVHDRCVGCLSNADCGWEGPLCDPADQTCVQCRVNLGFSDCDGMSCNALTRECTDTPRRSVGNCGRCVADEECRGDDRDGSFRCVAVRVQGTLKGHFCLMDQGLRHSPSCPSSVGFPQEATSLGGVSATYCFPDPAVGC